MKTSSDALFRLIKSMTKGEKTYFKKFTSSYSLGNSSTNYIKLFDAISKLSEYDEEALLKKFRKEAFVKNFVETKQYLKTQIIKALRNYSPNKTIISQLREDLFSIEILIKKGIVDLARTQIKKSLKVAKEHELIHYVLEINKLEFQVALYLGDPKYLEVFATETVQEENRMVKQIGNIQHYWHRYVQLMYSWKKHGPMKQREDTTNFEDYPLDSFNAANWYFIREISIGQVFNKKEAFHKSALSYYQLFKKYPSQIDLNLVSYTASLELYTSACGGVNDVEEGLLAAKEGISLLEKKGRKNEIAYHSMMIHLIALHDNQMLLYLHYGSRALLKEHHHSFKELVSKALLDGTSYPNLILRLGNVFIGEVILEDWEAAEESYQQMMNYKIKGHRNDIESVIRLLGVILYYETNNEVLLDTTINATYQFLRTKDFLFKFNRQFINLFKHKIVNALNEVERIEYLTQFRAETLVFFEENPEEGNVLNYFDFIAWMDSKIEQVSIYEAYHKRLQARMVQKIK